MSEISNNSYRELIGDPELLFGPEDDQPEEEIEVIPKGVIYRNKYGNS